MITAKVNLADIELHLNNHFNPGNYKSGKRYYPPEFMALAKRILKYRNSDMANTKGLASAKEGQVSVTFATTADGVPADWTQVFKRELAAYRRAKFI